MAINKVMLAALKALSYTEPEITEGNYKAHRQLHKLAHYPILKPFYKLWDHKVMLDNHEIPVRIFAPMSYVSHRPVLLFFHGGGWVTGDIDSYTKVCVNLAQQTGHLVISVDYRLAPEHRFPAATEDCYAVLQEIAAQAETLDIDLRYLTLIGDSAGGNLAAAVSLMARDRGGFMPERQILIYPSTYNDHSPQSPFDSVLENGSDYLLTSKRICDYMELYRSTEADLNNPYFAPLLAKDFAGQPKTLVITAQYDPLRDEGEAYGRRLQAAGVAVEIRRIPDTLHGFFSLPLVFQPVRDCYDMINSFLKGGEPQWKTE